MESAASKRDAIIGNEQLRRQLLFENAGLLLELEESGDYQDLLGHEDGTWAEFLADNEIHYSRNEVYELTRIYRKFHQELGININLLADVPRSRLFQLIPVVDEINVYDWLNKAKVLTTYDWNHEVREAKSLPVEDDGHEHDMELYQICKKCGSKHRHEEHTDAQ